MGILRFSDRVQINTGGEYRVIADVDGHYVVGQGLMAPVDSLGEGEELIAILEGRVEEE